VLGGRLVVAGEVVGTGALAAGAAGEARRLLQRRRVRSRLRSATPRRSAAARGGPLVAVGHGAERVARWLGGGPPPSPGGPGEVWSQSDRHGRSRTRPPGSGSPVDRIDPAERSRLRWRGAAVLAGVAAVPASPPAAALLVVAAWWAPLRLARRRAERLTAELVRDLPLAVELLAVAAHAGLTVAGALAAVAPHVEGDLGRSLGHAAGAAGRGQRLAAALAELADELGPPARPLAAVLTAAARDGDPLAPALDRLAESLRRARRHRAEVAARRLSVQLLLPLVLCVLPAFALLTVVPLLLGSLHSLPR
jgi:Flp pilus assembly protein TadB